MPNVFESGSGEEMGKHPAPVGAPIGPPPDPDNHRLRPIKIVAVFCGRDGNMGFQYNQSYELDVANSSVRRSDRGGPWCPYGSLEAFFRNWIVTGSH